MTKTGDNAVGIAPSQLKSFIERIERMEEEKAANAADIREIYAEAKSSGFEPKIMRQVVRLRKMDRDDRQEQEALLDLYLNAVGELVDTPLGRAGLNRLSKTGGAGADACA